jgi:hypothetical protein
MLHLTNGDVVAGMLRETGLPGEVAVTADVLHEGPCLATADPAEWRETRARFLADSGAGTYDEVLERYVEADAALHAARDHDEVVLWFEHDLFDQLLLIRLLAWFATHGRGAARLTLICIGSYPGVARFHGLGQLTGSQLSGLFPSRAPVSEEQFALGVDAWTRFGSDDPTGLAALLGHDTAMLPFLADAVRRQLEEYPWTTNGLSRSEHQALAAVAAGASDLMTAFRSTQEMEPRVFMGDASFFRLLRGLGDAALPLVHLDTSSEPGTPGLHGVSLTPLGREVLAGRADYVRLNGLDRWIGGVHLRGRGVPWRWDPDRGLVSV